MILYLDASALVKRYVDEPGSVEVNQAISQAKVTGTALVSRAEVVAALARAVRVGALAREDAANSLQTFRDEWPDLVRVQVTEFVIARADGLAWEYGLRGSNAIHLAAASLWQEMLGEPVILATFDRHLWTAARQVGLAVYPADLPTMLDQWKGQQAE